MRRSGWLPVRSFLVARSLGLGVGALGAVVLGSACGVGVIPETPGSGSEQDSDASTDPSSPGTPTDTAPPEDSGTAAPPPPPVRINELMAANRGSTPAPDGAALDWVELVNLHAGPVDLTGWALSDDWREPGAAPLPAGLVLAPGERVVLWLDPESGAADRVALGLASEGEVLRLSDDRGQEVDVLAFPELRVDHAWARLPDGTGEGEAMPLGTPGSVNGRVVEAEQTLIAEGSTWRYLDGGAVPTGGIDGPWTTLDFDDTAWGEGGAPLGYGDTQITVIDDGATDAGRAITAFFRHAFEVPDGQVEGATLGLRVDDGARVWLDGVELTRLGLPAGAIDADTTASRTASGDTEITFALESVDPAGLTPGPHLIAVDLHQANASSSDMTLDLTLSIERLEVVPVP